MVAALVAVLFWYRAHRTSSIAKVAPLICVFLVPAGILYLLFPADPKTTNLGIKLVFSLRDPQNVNTLPILVLFYFVFKNIRRDVFKRNLVVVLPWHVIYVLMLIVGGITKEVRIWYPLLLLSVPCFLLSVSEAQVGEANCKEMGE